MPRQLPPLNALRAFEAAARHENFSRAAEELNVSHAAISRHVRGLEKRLGVQLFAQAKRGVRLTSQGNDYQRAVSEALDQIAEATENLTHRESGDISVSCETTLAVRWLMPRLVGLRREHPVIRVEIDATWELADIARSEKDVALRYCIRPVEGLESDLLMPCIVYPYGSPDLPMPRSLQDLLEIPLLHEDKGELWCRWFADAGMEDVKLPALSKGLASLLAIEGAMSGQGAALLSHELVSKAEKSGELIRLFPHGLEFGEYRMVYRRESLRRAEFRTFRDWLLEESREWRDG